MVEYKYFDHVTTQGTKYTNWLQEVGTNILHLGKI